MGWERKKNIDIMGNVERVYNEGCIMERVYWRVYTGECILESVYWRSVNWRSV